MALLSKKQLVLFILFVLPGWQLFAQPNTTINLEKEKPKAYENRKLRSEKTEDTKFTAGKRFFQNMVTHYNYFFNANNKLNDIISRAKASCKDDYSQLLSFYNYTLDATAQQKQQLDSVIYKCNAGILLHDLRNNWIDDMYLLLGKAYLLRKNFDSAQQVFQYINYIYAPKDDGYDIPIGSNSSGNNGVFSVATNEDAGIIKKITGKPPTRNESFIWQIRNYIEQDKTDEATGLAVLLKADPKFPARLQTDLNEMIAYIFYKRKTFDSAAVYLEKALANAGDKTETGRWEFLAAQLYQRGGMTDNAIKLFNRSIRHTIDPYLEVYARLNLVQLSASGKKDAAINDHLAELYKLAKRDKYESYRDIIYYAVAVLQAQQQHTDNAINDLKKSLLFNANDIEQKQKSFLLLADLNYDAKKYKTASDNYDSIQTSFLREDEKLRVEKRKAPLKTISGNITNIHTLDSLLQLAELPDAERLAAIKKIYKQIRKEQGLKDISDNDFGSITASNTSTGLFSNTANNGGSFYFLNAAIKEQGFRDFKARWGNRPNVDNWQRQSAITKIASQQNNPFAVADVDQPITAKPTDDNKTITPEGLLLNIPLSEKRKQQTNDSIAAMLFSNGITFENKLEEYPAAIEAFTTLLKRYPNYKQTEKTLFHLAHCYFATGNMPVFDSLKTALNHQFPDGTWSYKINKGEFQNNNDSSVTITGVQKEFIAKAYENIYGLFIEGKFEEAKEEKLKADNSFGTKFWTPQLLFIESIYYIRQKQDSIAIDKLQSIVSRFATNPLAEKSKTMIDVLKRRTEIENYLTNLQIDSVKEEVTRRVDLDTVSTAFLPAITIKKDTGFAANKAAAVAKEIKTNVKPVTIADAGFVFIPTDAHYVVLVLNKVDEVFVNESKNAFSRFNRERFYNQKIELNNYKLNNQYTLLLMGHFTTAGDAVNYITGIKASVNTRIIPWLTTDKYYFNIISNANLEKVKAAKDIEAYSKFLKQIFPDKF